MEFQTLPASFRVGGAGYARLPDSLLPPRLRSQKGVEYGNARTASINLVSRRRRTTLPDGTVVMKILHFLDNCYSSFQPAETS